jgi:hypothetical protein
MYYRYSYNHRYIGLSVYGFLYSLTSKGEDVGAATPPAPAVGLFPLLWGYPQGVHRVASPDQSQAFVASTIG